MYVHVHPCLFLNDLTQCNRASQPHNPPAKPRLPNACLARYHHHGASRIQDGDFSCFSRTGRSESQSTPPGRTRRTCWAVRLKDLPGWLLSSTARDVAFDAEEPLSFEEFEKALRFNAPGDDSGGETTGINWWLLVGDVLTQPIFFGVFYLLASHAIRESRVPLMRRGVFSRLMCGCSHDGSCLLPRTAHHGRV